MKNISSLLIVILSTILLSTTSFAQINNGDGARIEKIERDMMLLQRQISKSSGGSSASSGASLSVGNASLEVRLSAIEDQMRELLGKSEENDFQIKKLTQNLDKIQRDTDFRFGELTHSQVTPAANTPAAAPETLLKPRNPVNDKEEISKSGKPVGKVVDTSPTETTDDSDAIETEFSTPRDHYNYAFRLLNQTQYDKAATAFADFIKKQPKDPLIGNAYYWQGEILYIRRNYVGAADSFRQGFEELPAGPKAPDNLLKLAMSLNALKRDKEACIVLGQVVGKFKTSSAAVAQKAEQEKRELVAANTEAVSADEFSELMNSIGFFEPNPTIAISISGGADSTALLLLAKEWIDIVGGKIIAITVNHNLRPEAEDEAKRVGTLCKELLIEHQILNWQHDYKVTSSIQEHARLARYQLLTECCKENNILHLLTAHHADDQIETMFFRLARGSGLEGLSAMSAQTIIKGVRLIRPFLQMPKTRLISTLNSNKRGWIEDPSNTNTHYSRVNIRRKLSDFQHKSEANLFIHSIGKFRSSLDNYLVSYMTNTIEVYHGGYAIIKTSNISSDALSAVIQTVNGEEHPPRSKKLDILHKSITEKKIAKKYSLAGLLFEPLVNDRILVYREENAIQSPVFIKNNDKILWDKRWLISLQNNDNELEIRSLGSGGMKQIKKNSPYLLQNQPVARIIRTFPSLWHLEELLCAPHIGYMSKQATLMSINCSVQFRPAKALAESCFFINNSG